MVSTTILRATRRTDSIDINAVTDENFLLAHVGKTETVSSRRDDAMIGNTCKILRYVRQAKGNIWRGKQLPRLCWSATQKHKEQIHCRVGVGP
jgi:hypothetical protein